MPWGRLGILSREDAGSLSLLSREEGQAAVRQKTDFSAFVVPELAPGHGQSFERPHELRVPRLQRLSVDGDGTLQEPHGGGALSLGGVGEAEP